MAYQHTVLKPVTLTFEREIVKCPSCGKMMEKHIVCEGARFHVLHWDNLGTHCSCKDCEINHRTRHYNKLNSKDINS